MGGNQRNKTEATILKSILSNDTQENDDCCMIQLWNQRVSKSQLSAILVVRWKSIAAECATIAIEFNKVNMVTDLIRDKLNILC